MIYSWFILTMASLGILSGCTDAPDRTVSETQSTVLALTGTMLANTEYMVELTQTGKAPLQNGVYEEPAAPGSATKLVIHLGELQTAGDITGDGTLDAAVTLSADPGGSGTFIYLVVVVNEDGQARPLESILLGDRVVVEALKIEPGIVLVTMLTRRPDEPMSVKPEVEVTRKFRLQGNDLVED